MIKKIFSFFFFIVHLLLLVGTKVTPLSPAEGVNFTYNGFKNAPNVSLTGIAGITPGGLLRLTNGSAQEIGRAYYSPPLRFKNSSTGNVFSFSTTFVFSILSKGSTLNGHGIAFVISPARDLPGALPSQYLGLFNLTTNGKSSNHVVAAELDTIRSTEFEDIDNNHVGIDVNSLKSEASSPAAYFTDENRTAKNISLSGGEPVQVWIEYGGAEKRLNVTVSPTTVPKPKWPLVSYTVDLASILHDEMFVGFSSSTGSIQTSHYISGWSFKMGGSVESLHLSSLPRFPRPENQKRKKLPLAIGLPLGIVFSLSAVSLVVYVVRRKIKFAEIIEDWELEYGPHRFFYRDLFIATNGFHDKELLGVGGFGKVHRGILPTSKKEVAVKRISHESRQGMKEFVAEIASIGRIRHPNLVRLPGYCRRKGELLLVYDFMPNGSLDKLIFGQPKTVLNWSQRFRIIKDVASGLQYLHEDWTQVVLHRDIKASNVLLDREMNGALGDFGLARLYDHGTDPQTTHMVGTYGYIAPELARTGKATTCTDVFAFGIFLLEVACGKRPLPPKTAVEEAILVDWVVECWRRGGITEAADPNLEGDYSGVEMELVLKLGLLCSHPWPASRPTMGQVGKYLDGEDAMPLMSPDGLDSPVSKSGSHEAAAEDLIVSFTSVGSESILSSDR
ncbi:hypothetical protein ACLOJK_012724 [Asimina triloba]